MTSERLLLCLLLPLVSGYSRDSVIKNGDTCSVNRILKDASELAGCSKIVGTLEFAAGATGSLNTAISEIYGCVFIVNTQLTSVKGLESADLKGCDAPLKSKISGNSNICINSEDSGRKKLELLGFQSTYDHCPICFNQNSTMGCGTLVSNMIWNDTDPTTFPKDLRELRGRLMIHNVTVPKLEDLIIDTSSNETYEIPLILQNTTVPEERQLEMVSIRTQGKTVIKVVDIFGYRYPREGLAKLQNKYPDRHFSIDYEEDTDCYFPYQNSDPIKIKINDILGCQRIFGRIHIEIDDPAAVSDVTYMESREQIVLIEKEGTEITHSLRNMQMAKAGRAPHHQNIEIKFNNEICYKKATVDFVNSWLEEDVKTKIVYTPTLPCWLFIGFMNKTNIVVEESQRMKTVYGALDIDYPKDYAKLDQFKMLDEIVKHFSVPSKFPAFQIHMCHPGRTVVPYVDDIKITSERDDDLLIKITGDSFKMTLSQYKKLEDKFGAQRIEADFLMPNDCVFSASDGPLANLSLLDGCERIIGDLYLEGEVNGSTTAVIREVTRCLRIVDTTLTDLYFINLVVPFKLDECDLCGNNNSEITGNKELCSNAQLTNIPKYLFSQNKEGCGNDLKKHEIHEGNILITGPYNESQLSHYSMLKELHGKITVIRCDAEYLDIFQSLESISFTGLGAAIHLEDNPNLKEIALPSLKNITVKGDGSVFVSRRNPNLEINTNLTSFYKKVSNNGSVHIYEEKPIYSDEPELIDGILEGLKVGLSVVGGLCLLGILVGVTVGVVKIIRKKRSKKGKKNMKKMEKTTVVSMDDEPPQPSKEQN